MRSGVPLKSCSGCRIALYCSVECQRKAWKAHKLECKGAAKAESKAAPAEVPLLLDAAQQAFFAGLAAEFTTAPGLLDGPSTEGAAIDTLVVAQHALKGHALALSEELMKFVKMVQGEQLPVEAFGMVAESLQEQKIQTLQVARACLALSFGPLRALSHQRVKLLYSACAGVIQALSNQPAEGAPGDAFSKSLMSLKAAVLTAAEDLAGLPDSNARALLADCESESGLVLDALSELRTLVSDEFNGLTPKEKTRGTLIFAMCEEVASMLRIISDAIPALVPFHTKSGNLCDQPTDS
eukprot:TRINITY_DN6189_c0_g1_i2.p1 TRINITY_DN6189_c0_g1~~TRINITY_DN6189_c0_g1_i2.p1  ORF type:complete len:308 (-),score=64.76 TRINITY_DN6189_c0_g1_i2:280-1167(-)